jgi:hypothetical protein
MLPGHSQVLQGVLVKTVVIIRICYHLISNCIPIHQRRSRDIPGSSFHLTFGTPLDELDSWRTQRATRLNHNLLQRNQPSDTSVQCRDYWHVGTLHLYRTGRPAVDSTGPMTSTTVMMTTLRSSLTTMTTCTLTTGTGVLPFHATPRIIAASRSMRRRRKRGPS